MLQSYDSLRAKQDHIQRQKVFYEYEFNGKKIAFHRDNVIHVQVGKGKGRYDRTYTYLAPDFARAVFQFNCINVGNGYKKRLICFDLNKPLLARVIT